MFVDPSFVTRGRRGTADSPSVKRLKHIIAQEYGVPKSLLLHKSRCRAEAAHARQVAMYLMHVALGESLTSVGAAFSRDRTTVSYACALIEDMRDDTEFDAKMDRLEHLLVGEGSAHA